MKKYSTRRKNKEKSKRDPSTVTRALAKRGKRRASLRAGRQLGAGARRVTDGEQNDKKESRGCRAKNACQGAGRGSPDDTTLPSGNGLR